MENESRENEARLASLTEEVEKLVGAYNDTQKDDRNFPEVKKEVVRNLKMIVEKIEEIDPERISEEAKNILENEPGDQE